MSRCSKTFVPVVYICYMHNKYCIYFMYIFAVLWTSHRLSGPRGFSPRNPLHYAGPDLWWVHAGAIFMHLSQWLHVKTQLSELPSLLSRRRLLRVTWIRCDDFYPNFWPEKKCLLHFMSWVKLFVRTMSKSLFLWATWLKKKKKINLGGRSWQDVTVARCAIPDWQKMRQVVITQQAFLFYFVCLQ